jgi:hypothetical protein
MSRPVEKESNMTPIGSTATLPEKKTAPPVNGKDLVTKVDNTPTTRPDGKNLLIEIDVGPEEAVFHCGDEEHVGTHKQRFVLFRPNKHCWLVFTNKSLFTEDYLELNEGEKTPAYVADSTRGETGCRIWVSAAKTAKVAKMVNTAPDTKHGPVIVVP